jgi:hypothetical protein
MPLKALNSYNGRTYNHWRSVLELDRNSGLVATKIKNGKYTQIFISANGKTKELLHDGDKIMDITDNHGQKRTYLYERDDKNNIIKGQMIVAKDEKLPKPLINAAKWIVRNSIPEKLLLKINNQHPKADIFIPLKHLANPTKKDIANNGKKINITEVMAKHFENVYSPEPKTIILNNKNNEQELIISQQAKENSDIINQLGIHSDVLGLNLTTFV